MSKVIRDDFTARLIEVCNYLMEKKIIPKKKDVAALLHYKASSYNMMEVRERNFPKELQDHAVMVLVSRYYANPAYLRGKSEQMFVKEPEAPAMLTVGKHNRRIHSYAESKAKLKVENEKLQKELEEVKHELLMAMEELGNYRKSDKHSDKSSSKSK